MRHHGVPAGRQLLGEGRPATDERRVVEASRRSLRRDAAQIDAESTRPGRRRRRLRPIHMCRFQLARQSPESHGVVRCVGLWSPVVHHLRSRHYHNRLKNKYKALIEFKPL